MKLSRRRAEEEPAVPSVDDSVADQEPSLGKGRPTPKRRDAVGARGPVTAPKTRKEAYARQKEITKAQRTARRTPTSQLTAAQRRELMRQGDPSVLPRRDQGTTRKLARDYVDSHRMASNYLLLLFPLIIVGTFVPFLQIVVLAVFIGLLAEWYAVGKRIRRLATERYGEAQGGNLSIGFYAGSRAYLPRRWRLPAPQREIGDPV